MRQGQVGRALRQFTLSNGKSTGRNSSGHITIFHRGGGAKRLQRRVDLKRSTSSIGIVERVEYDPNRSSRIALVRWVEGVQPQPIRLRIEEFAPPHKILEPTTTSIRGQFSCLKMDQRKEASFSTDMKVSLPAGMSPLSKRQPTATSNSKGEGIKRKITSVKDAFFSAFSSPKAKGETASLSLGSSFGFPRIAVAGAKPAFFAPRMREKVGESTLSLCNIRKSGANSSHWENRIKRKAALSWWSFWQQHTLGLVGAVEDNELKPNTDKGRLPTKLKDGMGKVERAPVTYIIASHSLEAGKMVMNCDWYKLRKCF